MTLRWITSMYTGRSLFIIPWTGKSDPTPLKLKHSQNNFFAGRGGTSTKWVRGTKRKKLKPSYGYNFRSLCHTNNWVFWLIPKESALWYRRREKNLQCRTTDMGVRGRAPAAGGKRVCSDVPSVWRFLQFFNKFSTFLGIFGLKFLLQNIFLLSSIIQNGRRSRHESAEEQNI